jgi:hypothetical protein
MYLPPYEPEEEEEEEVSSQLSKKYPKKVIVSITTHGGIKLLTKKSIAIERSNFSKIKRFTFQEKIPNSKIILVNTAPIGSINFTNPTILNICNRRLLDEFNKHINTKKTTDILKSINSIIKKLYKKILPTQSPSPTSSQSPTTQFVKSEIPYLQELDRLDNFDVFTKLFDTHYKSKNIEITKENIEKRYLEKQRRGEINSDDDIPKLIQNEYYKKLYVDWFEETYGVQVIKNNDLVIEKYYSASVYEREKNPKHDFNIEVLNSSSKSLITDLNIQPVKVNPEKYYSDKTEEKKETQYSTKLSDIINHLNSNGAEKIIIFDFSCAVIIKDEELIEVEDKNEILKIRTKEKKRNETNILRRKRKRSNSNSNSSKKSKQSNNSNSSKKSKQSTENKKTQNSQRKRRRTQTQSRKKRR